MLKKTILIKSHGIPCAVHRVTNVSVDLDNKASNISVASYYDEAARADKASPLSTTTVYVQAAPAQGQDLVAFAESALVAAKPDASQDVAVAVYGADRYAFEGAQIIADPAQ